MIKNDSRSVVRFSSRITFLKQKLLSTDAWPWLRIQTNLGMEAEDVYFAMFMELWNKTHPNIGMLCWNLKTCLCEEQLLCQWTLQAFMTLSEYFAVISLRSTNWKIRLFQGLLGSNYFRIKNFTIRDNCLLQRTPFE